MSFSWNMRYAVISSNTQICDEHTNFCFLFFVAVLKTYYFGVCTILKSYMNFAKEGFIRF